MAANGAIRASSAERKQLGLDGLLKSPKYLPSSQSPGAGRALTAESPSSLSRRELSKANNDIPAQAMKIVGERTPSPVKPDKTGPGRSPGKSPSKDGLDTINKITPADHKKKIEEERR